MDIRLRIIVFILYFVDKIANFLELFGIKLKRITRETTLKGIFSYSIAIYFFCLLAPRFKSTLITLESKKNCIIKVSNKSQS